MQDSGIRRWEANKKILEAISQVKELPESILKRTQKLQAYNEVRLQSFVWFEQAVRKNKTDDTATFNGYNRQIEGLMQELKTL